MHKYCTNCGEIVGDQAKFCAACGEEIVQTAQVPEPESPGFSVEKESEGPKIEADEVASSERSAPSPAPTAASTHPWRRFLARNVDVLLGGLLVFFALILAMSLLFPSNVPAVLEAVENPLIAGMAIYLCWVPIEACFLAALGTTPAKWAFGISISNSDGTRLSFGGAVKRTVLVLIQGEGAGIPLITLFTRLFAYRRLVNTGTTLWDADVGSVVHHKEWGAIRAIACTLIVIFTLAVFSMLNAA